MSIPQYIYTVSKGEDACDFNSIVLATFSDRERAESCIKNLIPINKYHKLEKIFDDPESLVDGWFDDETGYVYFLQKFKLDSE